MGEYGMFKRPFKMVLIDDEPEIVEILSECIKDMFPSTFDIAVFSDPEAALKYIENEGVTVVVTDVSMPKINGDHVNLKVKQMGVGIQTIILTGNQNMSTAMTCFRDGANGYIQKPFDMEEVQDSIQAVLNSLLSWEKVFAANTKKKAS